MSQHDTTSREAALGDQINGYKNLYPRQKGYNQWNVLSFRSGEATAYPVNLEELTCPCEDEEHNRDGNEVCDHIAVALYESKKHQGLDQAVVRDLATNMGQIERAADAVQDAADTAEGLLVQARDEQAGQATQESSDDSQDDETDDGENYSELQPDDAQAGMCRAIRDWIGSAQQFNSDIDPEIIQTKWIEIEGKEGVWVDRAPFYNDATYYDDGDWQDKDGFDAASEAVGDLLSNRDEFEWYGEPDYVWFIPESKVSEVTG
jgi:hypothetical protein